MLDASSLTEMYATECFTSRQRQQFVAPRRSSHPAAHLCVLLAARLGS